jgi:hypothetical protein
MNRTIAISIRLPKTTAAMIRAAWLKVASHGDGEGNLDS